MNIIQELEKIASQKDPETQQKIIAIKNQLAPLLQDWPYPTLTIRPEDIKQAQNICPEVLDLVEIIKYFLCNKSNGTSLNIKQKVIIEERKKRNPSINFEINRLDAMERIYREHGRSVSYDAPGMWDSNYDPYFIFKAK